MSLHRGSQQHAYPLVSCLQAGYAAFGEHTRDIITLNLPEDWSTVAVKLSLCLGLLFTFPVMMVPVYEIVERSLQSKVHWSLGVASRLGTPTQHNTTDMCSVSLHQKLPDAA